MVGTEQVASEIITLRQNRRGGGVVLLHGPVGVGKTAVARALFERIDKGLQGVLTHWVELRKGLITSELLGLQTGLHFSAAGSALEFLTLEDRRQAVRKVLQGRRVVLAVDGVS